MIPSSSNKGVPALPRTRELEVGLGFRASGRWGSESIWKLLLPRKKSLESKGETARILETAQQETTSDCCDVCCSGCSGVWASWGLQVQTLTFFKLYPVNGPVIPEEHSEALARPAAMAQAFTRAVCSVVGFMVMRPGRMLSLSSLEIPQWRSEGSFMYHRILGRSFRNPEALNSLDLRATCPPNDRQSGRTPGHRRSSAPQARLAEQQDNMNTNKR